MAAHNPITIREGATINGKLGAIGRGLTLLLLAITLVGSVLSGVAQADTAAINKAKSEAEALREKIAELDEQLDAAVEEYNFVKAKLAETRAAIEGTQEELGKAQADLELANTALTERLVEIYKQGKLGVLDVLVGSASFSDLVNNLDLLQRLSEQDALLVEQVRDYREEVSARQADLARQLEEEKQLLADVEAARNKVEQQLTAAEKALAGKEAQVAQLEKEEAERQARLAEEARKQAEEAKKKAAEEAAKKKAEEEAARTAAQQSSTVKKTATLDSEKSVGVSVPESVSASGVVSIAMQYLGCPYVWGGASPSGFDCSGFAMYVYKKVGVSLPHSSRMQYSCGQPVARSDLRPGDLVFFYNPISHVGIYIGDGKMIHAAGSGKDVRISEVWTKNYYGACRIIM